MCTGDGIEVDVETAGADDAGQKRRGGSVHPNSKRLFCLALLCFVDPSTLVSQGRVASSSVEKVGVELVPGLLAFQDWLVEYRSKCTGTVTDRWRIVSVDTISWRIRPFSESAVRLVSVQSADPRKARAGWSLKTPALTGFKLGTLGPWGHWSTGHWGALVTESCEAAANSKAVHSLADGCHDPYSAG